MITVYITLLALIFLYLYWNVPARFRLSLILIANFSVLAWLGSITLSLYAVAAAVVAICSTLVSRLDPIDRKGRRRAWLIFVVVMTTGPLIYFRAQTAMDRSAINPMAISYLMLMLLGYFMDVYRGTVKPVLGDKSFFGFSSFFALSAMGPIERFNHLSPQLRQPRQWDGLRAYEGLFLISLGIFKKVVIADRLASFIDGPEAHYLKYSGLELWFYCICGFIQIFCDFSGWIDIVRGFAKLMGIDLLDNFNQPYFARSVPDIWRRWHMSLVNWLRDFVYTPVALKTKNLHVATLTVMLLVGVWHTFSWKATLWAAYWSGLYSLAIFGRQRGWSIKLPIGIKILGVFLLMSLSTVFLIPESPRDILRLLTQLFQFSRGSGLFDAHLSRFDAITSISGFLFVVCLETYHRRAKSKAMLIAVAVVVLLLAIVLAAGSSKAFIYMRY